MELKFNQYCDLERSSLTDLIIISGVYEYKAYYQRTPVLLIVCHSRLHNLFSLLLADTAMEREAKGFGNVGLFLAVKKQRNLERNTMHETAVTSHVIKWRTIKQLT